MPVTVVTTSPGFARAGQIPERIAELGWNLVRCTGAPTAEQLQMADVLVAGLPAVTADVMAQATNLKAVIKHGVGLDSIDVRAATALGLPVLSTPGANANAVAEMALGAVFALFRNTVTGHLSVTSGGWVRKVGREVQGATLGIVGLGAIGRLLAQKARGVGMKVIAAERAPDLAFCTLHQITILPLQDVLMQADAVSLHVFGGADNAALIGAAELALMKPNAVLLNFARGEVVDLDALAAALDAGKLGGAAIDAYVSEPPDLSHPIFSDPRVLFSPHSGADTTESLLRTGNMVIDDIVTLLAGGRPARIINPVVFDQTPQLEGKRQ